MKYPLTLKITYIAKDEYPVTTCESTHYIQSPSDFDVVCSLLGVYSERDWNMLSLVDAIKDGFYIGETESITFELL